MHEEAIIGALAGIGIISIVFCLFLWQRKQNKTERQRGIDQAVLQFREYLDSSIFDNWRDEIESESYR